MKKAQWLWIAGYLIAVIIGFWRYEYAIHSTPQKAQALIDPAVGPFETVKFAKGEILFTPSSQGGRLMPGT